MTHPIINATAVLFRVNARALVSASRDRELVQARHAAIYALTQQGMSLANAAAIMGRSDHTTALYAREQAAKRIAVDAAYAAQVRTLCGVAGPLETAARALLDGAVPFGRQALVDAALLDALREAL